MAFSLNFEGMCDIMNKKWQKYTNEIYLVILTIIIFTLVALIIQNSHYFTDNHLFINIFLSLLITCVIIFTGALVIKINLKKYQFIIYVLLYSMLLFYALYFRNVFDDKQFNEDFYLWKWLKILFVNRTVFINVIGNIILFVPLGIIIKKRITLKTKKYMLFNILITALIIFILELAQYFSKRGIFDYTDIALNLVGAIIGLLIVKKGDLYAR